MQENSSKKQYLKNEKIQIYLRIVLVSIVIIHLLYLYIKDGHVGDYPFIYLLFLPVAVLLLNIYYLSFLKKHPYLYQQQRIVILMSLDIIATVSVMYLVDGMAIYYPGLLLWYIIGYGVRYGLKMGYLAYLLVLICWSMLMYYSDFWIEHFDTAMGWLVAYAILPLYYFKLIVQLQNKIERLHIDVDESTFRARHDVLTELPNRLLFEKTLDKYINDYEKTKQKFALFFIDLDKFKEINDEHGHAIGDHVLIEAARRIKDINGFTSRLGGDEFVCIVEYISMQELEDRAIKLVKNISKKCDNSKVTVSASIGISCYPQDSTSAHDIKKYSDKAMYKAKHLGKNKYCFYSELENSN